jgi:hypothetical protein
MRVNSRKRIRFQSAFDGLQPATNLPPANCKQRKLEQTLGSLLMAPLIRMACRVERLRCEVGIYARLDADIGQPLDTGDREGAKPLKLLSLPSGIEPLSPP